FRVLTCGICSASFAILNGLTLGNGLYLDPEYDDTGLSLVAQGGHVPPPPDGHADQGRTPRSLSPSLLAPPQPGTALEALLLAGRGSGANHRIDEFFRHLFGYMDKSERPLQASPG